MKLLRPALVPAALATALVFSVLAFTAAATPPQLPVRRAAQVPVAAVPILLYHHIAPVPKHVRSPAIYVPARIFQDQIAALAAAGFQAITLDQLTSAWQDQTPLPDKPVIITFDDGYTDQATVALPILRRYGWPAVLYLAPRSSFPDRISRPQVKRLLTSGWQLAAHTLTHPDLTKTSRARMIAEITGSRRQLSAAYDTAITAFAYPYGHLNTTVEDAVRQAGFTTATTTKSSRAGRQDDPLRLPRIIVTSHTSPATLLAKVNGR